MIEYIVRVHDDGTREWFEETSNGCYDLAGNWVNGRLHRVDGPAVEYPNEHNEWHVHGVRLTEEEFNKRNG